MAAADWSKVAHGETRTTPLKGAASDSGATEGCGCRRWERSARERLPPAESPARIIWGRVSEVGEGRGRKWLNYAGRGDASSGGQVAERGGGLGELPGVHALGCEV